VVENTFRRISSLGLLLIVFSAQAQLRAAPVLLSDAADPLLKSLHQELQPPRASELPWGATTEEIFQRFSFQNAGKCASGKIEAVEGQLFKQALHVTSCQTEQEWMTFFQGNNKDPVRKGDAVYVTAFVRAGKVRNEWGLGKGRLYHGNGGTDFTFPARWERQHLHFEADKDYAPGELKLMWTFGHQQQELWIGGIVAINLGQNFDRTKLPTKPLQMDYEGREPGAEWRKEALARIEKIRKAPIKVRVLNSKGAPLRDAEIKVEMKKHAFIWGTSAAIGMFPGQNVKPWNADFQRTAGASEKDKEKFREILARYFNATTQGTTWSAWSGADARFTKEDILAGMKWFHENGLIVKNVQVVYPSPEFAAPNWASRLSQKVTDYRAGKPFDPQFALEFSNALRNVIFEYAKTFKPFGLYSFEIANELEGRPEYTSILGGDKLDRVTEWFRWAEQADPTIKRIINNPGATEDYHAIIRGLIQRKAPLQGIGFQMHSGIGSESPLERYRLIDRYHREFGLPIEVTEYEMTLQNGNDLRQREYQADYTRDMLIAAFSHPAVSSFTLQDFWQPACWQYEGASAFWNADWSLNPHGHQFIDLVHGKWWTREKGVSDSSGIFQCRGFLGTYEITIAAAGKELKRTIQLTLESGDFEFIIP
jgi:hypothetical protein